MKTFDINKKYHLKSDIMTSAGVVRKGTKIKISNLNEAKKRAEAEIFKDNEIKNHGSYTDYQRSPSLIL